MKEAESVEGAVRTDEIVPEFCLLFAGRTMHVWNRATREDVKNVIRVVSEAGSDPDQLLRHVEILDSCKRILDKRRDEKPTVQVIKKKNVKNRRDSSVSGAVLYKKGVLAVFQRHMATNSSQNVFSSLQDVLQDATLLSGSLHGQRTQRKLRERVTALGNCDMWWNSETSQSPRSLCRIDTDVI